jgi:hypothetical protein
MQILQSYDNFSSKKTGNFLRENFLWLPFKKKEKLSARAKIRYQTNVGLSLHIPTLHKPTIFHPFHVF